MVEVTGWGHRSSAQSYLDVNWELRGPFGESDGARESVDSWLDIGGVSSWSADDRVRVIAGRKGSGKTFELRRIRDRLEGPTRGGRLIIDAEQTQLPLTRHVVAYSALHDETLLTEAWQHLWGRAILLCLLSHFTRDESFKRALTDFDRAALEKDFVEFNHLFRTEPKTPFTAMRSILVYAGKGRTQGIDGESIRRLLDDPLWDDLESRFARLLRTTPEVHIFVDAVDEEFAHAPAAWMRCQKGLFYETMRFQRHRDFGSKLQVVISVRDIVLLSVAKSEHAPRYVGDPRIRVLQWDLGSAREFLDIKASQLPRDYWFTGRPRSFADWVGVDRISLGGGRSIDIYEFALGMTQALPREMVVLGNLLALKATGGRVMNIEAVLRSCVTIGRLSAKTQLEICLNQLASDEDFKSLGGGAIGPEIDGEQLHRFLASLGTSPVQRSHWKKSSERILGGGAAFVPSILWQNGLVGYLSEAGGVFFGFDSRGRMELPIAPAYLLHPSLAVYLESTDGLGLGLPTSN